SDGGTPAPEADDNVIAMLSAVQPAADKLFPKLPTDAYFSTSVACAALLLGMLLGFRVIRIPPAPMDAGTASAAKPHYGTVAATSLIALGVRSASGGLGLCLPNG